MAEELKALLSIPDPLGDETKEAIEEAFDELDWKLCGIGEVVGWDADVESVHLHLLANEPERVIPLLIEALHALDVRDPGNSWRLIRRPAQPCTSGTSLELAAHARQCPRIRFDRRSIWKR